MQVSHFRRDIGAMELNEIRFRPMNRMEVEAKSEESINYEDGQTTVSMKNATSLGEYPTPLSTIIYLHIPRLLTSVHVLYTDEQLDQKKMVWLKLWYVEWKLMRVGFTFDRVFDSNTRQEDIFDFGVKTIVEGQLAILRTPWIELTVQM